jgi:hypothetical protein
VIHQTNPTAGSIRWGIYHQEREFARELGDPCLGVVMARSKEEAETKAQQMGLWGLTGLWAHVLPGLPASGLNGSLENPNGAGGLPPRRSY